MSYTNFRKRTIKVCSFRKGLLRALNDIYDIFAIGLETEQFAFVILIVDHIGPRIINRCIRK